MPSRALNTASGRPATFGNRIRERIDTQMVVTKLHEHVKGNQEMSATQIRAAEILLKRTVPELKPVEVDPDKLNDIKDITHVSNALLASVIEGKAERKK